MSRPPTRRRAARWLAGILAGVAVLVVAGFFLSGPVLRSVGRWLIVSEPLSPADAIVVLAGGTPGREREAAQLFMARATAARARRAQAAESRRTSRRGTATSIERARRPATSAW